MKTKEFISWSETHFEISGAISIELNKNWMSKKLKTIQKEEGHCGFYNLANKLTDEFEELNKNREWDGEFFDEVEQFIEKNIN